MSEIEVLNWPAGHPAIVGGFFGRPGGVSQGPFASLNGSYRTPDSPDHVRENRGRMASHLTGQAETPLYTANQVHGTRVLTVTASSDIQKTWAAEADALVTSTPGLLVGVSTADCVPVLVADPVAGVVAAVHCGWRSAFGQIAGEVAAAMEALGAQKSRIQAALGPSIQQASYEVDQAFYAAFQAQGEDPRFFLPGRPGHFLFDLPAYVIHTFQRAGIQNVQASGENTFTQPERFFSHRWAQANAGGLRGCQLSVIGVMG